MIKTPNEYKAQFHSELFDSVVPFWMKNGWDQKNGGVYSYLTKEGERCSNIKAVWIQGRFMWLLSKLCNVYGKNDEWLKAAKSCKEFIDKYCFAPDGRMYFLVTDDGKPVRKRRYWFSEAFYCMASAEYYKATGDTDSLETARRLFSTILSIYTDPASDPRKMPAKFEIATSSLGPPMIMLNVTNVMRTCDPERIDEYDAGAKKYISYVSNHFYREDLKCVLENVSAEGKSMLETPMGRLISPGHSLETAWFLMDEALHFDDKDLMAKALNIFDWSMELGWDKDNGGIIYFTDLKGYPPEQYEHDMKLWWPQNEATVAALKAYEITGDEKYYKWFETLVEYQFENFVDKEHGEWVGYLLKNNEKQLPITKGNYFKGPFHIPRMLIICEQVLSRIVNK